MQDPTLTQQLANHLLLNASFIDNLGLMHGKMGISICFFHLAKQTKNKIYEDYAGELIDEIYEEITANTPVDFENGLAGIGWGIEYLVQNGFIEADTDEVLEELDKAVFQIDRKKPKLPRIVNDFYGYGLYYLSRAKNNAWNVEVLQVILDDVKTLFTETILDGIKISPNYIISLLYFIQKIQRSPFCPSDMDKIIATLLGFVLKLSNKKLNNTEYHYLQILFKKLGIIPLPNLQPFANSPSPKGLLEELNQAVLYSILFPDIPKTHDYILNCKTGISKMLENEKNRNKIFGDIINKSNDHEPILIGCALAILNENNSFFIKPMVEAGSDENVFVFKRKSRASEYGIGTYIEELTSGLKSSIIINIVHLESDKQEFTIENIYGVLNWYIPLSKQADPRSPDYDKLYRTAVILMQLHIRNTDKIIFHLNSMLDYQLAQYLRKAFVCKILLVVHYMDWSFALQGDLSRMRNLLEQSEGKISGFLERKALNAFNKDRKIMEYVDHIVCLADYSKEIICQDYGIDKNKVTVVNNGLSDRAMPINSEERIRLRKKYLLSPDEKIILFAGRLDEIKGVSFLIKAFKEIIKHEPDSRLWIIGDGAYNPLFKEAEGIWSKLCFTGKIKREQLFELYRIADVGAVPSLFEPFGYVAIEMMMNSMPVVVTATGGLDEIVEDGVSGLKVAIVADGSDNKIATDLMAQRIDYLLKNPKERVQIGDNGRKRYLKKFTADSMCEKMINCYQRLL